MNRNLTLLIGSEFLSAFADNAVLFALVSLVQQQISTPGWYIPALQASFLVAFVLLAPWVGPWADARYKHRVLVQANLIKSIGAILLLANVEPMLAYAVIGIGAATYSPAKYGILPEISDKEQLVTANGWIQGTTIIAILGGGLTGAILADNDLTLAFATILGIYLLSGSLAHFINSPPPSRERPKAALPHFAGLAKTLLGKNQTRFAALGTSLFWGSAVTMRLAVVAWAPLVLGLTKASDIAQLTMFSAIGIAIGSFLASKLIALGQLHRARDAALFMAVAVLALSMVDTLAMARIVLLLIGIGGGIFIVPVNALIQHTGHKTVGSGGTVAVQHFFENLVMLSASGMVALATAQGASPVSIIVTLGIVVIAVTLLLSRHLPKDPVSAGAD